MIPARVEPVKDIMSTSLCSASFWPTEGPSPFTRLNTPFGTPASCMISAKMIALIGAISEGFSTIVLPAARAGATLQTIWFSGQFHGVISPHTPIGSLTTSVVPRRSSNGKVSNTSISAWKWAWPTKAWASLAKPIGAPISWLHAAAISSIRRS